MLLEKSKSNKNPNVNNLSIQWQSNNFRNKWKFIFGYYGSIPKLMMRRERFQLVGKAS